MKILNSRKTHQTLLSPKLFLLCFFICNIFIAQAQDSKNITVSGTVSDINGIPIIGASVIHKSIVDNTVLAGTITDLNGKYSISLPANVSRAFFLPFSRGMRWLAPTLAAGVCAGAGKCRYERPSFIVQEAIF